MAEQTTLRMVTKVPVASKFSEFSLNLLVFVHLVVTISYLVEFCSFSFNYPCTMLDSFQMGQTHGAHDGWPDMSAEI